MENNNCGYGCVSCKEIKPYEDFYQIKGKRDYYCKYCRNGYNIRNQTTHKKRSACTKGVEGCANPHYAKGMCRLCWTRNDRNGSPELKNKGKKDFKYLKQNITAKDLRRYHLKSHYQLTPEQFEEMSANGCHICGKQRLVHKQLHVDHDHDHCNSYKSCGLCVRGILCDSCNIAVGKYDTGLLRDDYPRRNDIIIYVSKHKFLLRDKLEAYDKEQRNR